MFWVLVLFVRSKSFHKKNWLEIVLIASYTILVICTPINPPIEGFFVRTYFYLWSSVRISFFMGIFLNPYLWESLLIYDHLWESIFLSLYENKLVYEFHHLKQIFYHQNMIMILYWFRMFQVYIFLLWTLLILCPYFFVKQSIFKFIKFSRNIYSFCCIRFFTIIWKHWIHLWL